MGNAEAPIHFLAALVWLLGLQVLAADLKSYSDGFYLELAVYGAGFWLSGQSGVFFTWLRIDASLPCLGNGFVKALAS